VFEAIDLNVSAPVITEALIRRVRSREENNFTDRMLSVMRNEFGGHAVKEELNAAVSFFSSCGLLVRRKIRMSATKNATRN
jgi:hypothetical protein